MEAYKVVWHEPDCFRSLFYPNIQYFRNTQHSDGPFFAFRHERDAEHYAHEFARSSLNQSPLIAISILKIQGTPFRPQPKRVPALYAPLWFLDYWRTIVYQDIRFADNILTTYGWFYDIPKAWILFRDFEIIEVVSSIYSKRALVVAKDSRKGGLNRWVNIT